MQDLSVYCSYWQLVAKMTGKSACLS
uniref:Uncharacterized protein n=1 Tax=Anguilla anguilla TaxID=7936 RepID=A0A0E9S8P3_ANGAN